jgi:hypothetical protein
MAIPLRNRPFSVHEFHRMTDTGILSEDDRGELIDGDIVEMAPIGPRHASCVMRLTSLLSRQPGGQALILLGPRRWVLGPLQRQRQPHRRAGAGPRVDFHPAAHRLHPLVQAEQSEMFRPAPETAGMTRRSSVARAASIADRAVAATPARHPPTHRLNMIASKCEMKL